MNYSITDAINTLIKDAGVDTNKISDGYHTFSELYEHRIELFITICRVIKDLQKIIGDGPMLFPPVWRSRFHSDGKIAYSGGWFVLGIFKSPGEQITYHLPEKYWTRCDFAETLDKAPEFDGHTSNDVLQRLKNL